MRGVEINTTHKKRGFDFKCYHTSHTYKNYKSTTKESQHFYTMLTFIVFVNFKKICGNYRFLGKIIVSYNFWIVNKKICKCVHICCACSYMKIIDNTKSTLQKKSVMCLKTLVYCFISVRLAGSFFVW